jgi:polyisoprenyl-phosphate glycosyltransferase
MAIDISVIVAVYNEDPRNLLLLLERLWNALSVQQLTYEVLFVNDGSKAKTSKALRQIASEVENVKLLELSRNFGQQAAISAGLDYAEGQAVVNIDSDLQDPPELITDMVKYWRAGYDVVYAQRATRRDRLGKQLSAFLFYRLLGSLSSVQIPMDSGDFRLIDRKVADQLRNLPEKTRFLRGLIPWLGFKQIGIPVHRDARGMGETSYTLRKLCSLAMDGLLSLSVAPLYLVPTIGLALLAVGGLAIILAAANVVAGLDQKTFLLLSALVFVAGLQIFCTGVVAVYISKILDEARSRPTYIVAHKLGMGFGRNGESITASEKRLSGIELPSGNR